MPVDDDVLAELPKTPGVYLFKDAEGRVIYIGKAKSLRSRVTSYFRASADHTPDKEAMVDEAVGVDVLETESEVDAFVLESRLIKDVQPKYNIRLRDGKSFPYLAVTKREDFPRVFIAREGSFDDRSVTLFGPFTDVSGLRLTLPVLQKVFKFRTCNLDIEEADVEKWEHYRPCLLHNIDMCTAPCALRECKEDYRKRTEGLKRFLKGKKRPLIKALEREMFAASKAMEFDRAALLRDQIRGLKSLGEMGRYGDFLPGSLLTGDPEEGLRELKAHLGLEVPPRLIEGIDIATIHGEGTVGSLVSFLDGVPFKDGYRRFKIKGVDGVDDFASIREVVRRRYRRLDEEGLPMPELVLIDGGVGQLNAAAGALEELGIALPLCSLAKREEIIHRPGHEPLKLPRNSRALHVLQSVRDEAHRFAQHYHHLLRHKGQLEQTVGGRRRRKRRQPRSRR